MKKTIFTYLLFFASLITLFSIFVSAENCRYHDEAELLNSSQADYLENALQDIYDIHKADVFIVVVEDLGHQSARSYANKIFRTETGTDDAKKSGVVLILSMEERDWHVYAYGIARYIFTDQVIDSVMEVLVSDYLSKNDFYNGFIGFANQCHAYFFRTYERIENEYANGDDPSLDDTPPSMGTCILIALSVGLVTAIVTVSILISQLKSVKSARDASGYVKHDSFALTESRDIFLYSTVSRSARSQSSSGSRSRSGGRSGKF